MKFTIITHVNHIQKENQYFGYAPYILEMNIWLKYINEVIVVAPLQKNVPTRIDNQYEHDKINFIKVPRFDLNNFKNSIKFLLKLPIISWKIFRAMKNADHIHLRCPGNVGLIGCFVQMLFPKKIKTAKYAGNWDPAASQPWSYKLQKYILNNTFLTKNMQVLVYGRWENQSKNIKPFFTASYSESEKQKVQKAVFDDEIKFIFAGSLTVGKNPLYAVKLVHRLIVDSASKITLNIYGEGNERVNVENYIKENGLERHVFLNGNQNKETLKRAYKESHFVILPSKSEGWPKAIAEGMFWGCVPIATMVSCVPFMLDYGNRGLLLKMDLEIDSEQVISICKNRNAFDLKSKIASEWSQKYTTDSFEIEIKKLLQV